MAKSKAKSKQNKATKKSSSSKDTKSEAVSEKSKSATKSSSNQMNSRNVILSAVIILLLLLGIALIVFGVFSPDAENNLDDSDTTSGLQTESQVDDVASNEDASQNELNNEDNGVEEETSEEQSEDTQQQESINDTSLSTDNNNVQEEESVQAQADSELERTSKYPATDTFYRRGNDYSFGDIAGSSYITQRGDTLWQIAEARYGSGYAWVDIANANGGYPLNPDGTPGLIPVGAEVILPTI